MSLLKFAEAGIGRDRETVMRKYAENDLYKQAVDLATTNAVIAELEKHAAANTDMVKEAGRISEIPGKLTAWLKANASKVKSVAKRDAGDFGRGMAFSPPKLSVQQEIDVARAKSISELLSSAENSAADKLNVLKAHVPSSLLTSPKDINALKPGQARDAALLMNEMQVHSAGERLIQNLVDAGKASPEAARANILGRLATGLGIGTGLAGIGSQIAIPEDTRSFLDGNTAIGGIGGALAGGGAGALYDAATNDYSDVESLIRSALTGAAVGGGVGGIGGSLYDNTSE